MSEITPGGSEIFHHTQPVDPAPVPDYDESLRTAIEQHLANYLPGSPSVLHEIISEGIHLDIYVWAPTPQRPIWTLVTVGMSEVPMNTPAEVARWRRCELVSALPADWPMPADPDEFQRVFEDEANYWPIRTLKEAARLPVTFDTWLGYGHTLQAAEDPNEPYEGSPYTGLFLGYPTSLPPEAVVIEHGDEEIFFWGVFPLHAEEMDFKLTHGADALSDLLEDAEYHEGVYRDRPLLDALKPKPGLLGRLLGRRDRRR